MNKEREKELIRKNLAIEAELQSIRQESKNLDSKIEKLSQEVTALRKELNKEVEKKKKHK